MKKFLIIFTVLVLGGFIAVGVYYYASKKDSLAKHVPNNVGGVLLVDTEQLVQKLTLNAFSNQEKIGALFQEVPMDSLSTSTDKEIKMPKSGIDYFGGLASYIRILDDVRVTTSVVYLDNEKDFKTFLLQNFDSLNLEYEMEEEKGFKKIFIPENQLALLFNNEMVYCSFPLPDYNKVPKAVLFKQLKEDFETNLETSIYVKQEFQDIQNEKEYDLIALSNPNLLLDEMASDANDISYLSAGMLLENGEVELNANFNLKDSTLINKLSVLPSSLYVPTVSKAWFLAGLNWNDIFESTGLFGLSSLKWIQTTTDLLDNQILVSYNGIKEVKQTTIESFFDEDTFEMREDTVVTEEKMPQVSFHFKTAKSDLVFSELEKSSIIEKEENSNYKVAFGNESLPYSMYLFSNKEGLQVSSNELETRKQSIGENILFTSTIYFDEINNDQFMFQINKNQVDLLELKVHKVNDLSLKFSVRINFKDKDLNAMYSLLLMGANNYNKLQKVF